MYNILLSSYDDLIQPDITQYCFERLMQWVISCRHNGQLKSVDTAIKLFRRMYPNEKARSQNLYRRYWQIKRDLNQF